MRCDSQLMCYECVQQCGATSVPNEHECVNLLLWCLTNYMHFTSSASHGSYSRGPELKSEPGGRLSWLKLCWRFHFLTAASMKTAVFWTSCGQVEVYRRFGGACCLHYQGYVFSLSFPQSIQTSAGIEPWTGARPLCSMFFPIHYSFLIILSYNPVQFELFTALLNISK
jgi:hypothetical protein